MIQGSRMARDRSRLASGSLRNSSLAGSYLTYRFSHMQILAACTVDIERYMNSGLATVCRRDLTQSKKFRTWFMGRCVWAMYSRTVLEKSPSRAGEDTSG